MMKAILLRFVQGIFLIALLAGLSLLFGGDQVNLVGEMRSHASIGTPGGNLYPEPQPPFEALKLYPGAQYVHEYYDPSKPDPDYDLFFETDSDWRDVDAYYQGLLTKYGWRTELVERVFGSKPIFYLGDYGRSHIYGYYLEVFAFTAWGTPEAHLKTSVQISISKSLPIFQGATSVKTKKNVSIDTSRTTLDYTVRAKRGDVLSFYRCMLPEGDWTVDNERASETEIACMINASSYARVKVQTQDCENVYVQVEIYFGCCS